MPHRYFVRRTAAFLAILAIFAFGVDFAAQRPAASYPAAETPRRGGVEVRPEDRSGGITWRALGMAADGARARIVEKARAVIRGGEGRTEAFFERL